MSEIKAQYDVGVAELNNIGYLLLRYVSELIKITEELSVYHKAIKDCDAFLQQYAARKKAYIATDYFEEQIEAIKETQEDGWEMQVKIIEDLLNA